MKRITFIALLMTLAVSSQAQTAKKLMAKYKAYPEATYQFIGGDSLRIKAGESGEPAEDIVAMCDIRSVEVVQVQLDEKQRANLTKELKALKGYEELMNLAKTPEEPVAEEDENPARAMLRKAISPVTDLNIKIQAFGKVKNENVTDALIVINVFDVTVLVYLDGKIAIADLPKVLTVDSKSGFSIDDDDDGDDGETVDVKEMLKQAKDSCIVTFDGEIQPDFHNEKEATRYIVEHDLNMTGVEYLIGKKTVKERFPHIDANIVVNIKDVKPRDNESNDE